MIAIKKFLRAGDQIAYGENGEEPPLRAELFSADQMERHGIILAEQHKNNLGHGASDQLLERLSQNAVILQQAFGLLTTSVKMNRRITPAGEWLLDNFYLIEEQILTAKRHLPKEYSLELPSLSTGTAGGVPRVYDIALSTISHGDGRVEPQSLSRFVTSYQTVSELKLGELWAIPIMLRLALIENLRRVAARIASDMLDRDLATEWADKMIDVANNDPKGLILVVADMARSNPPLLSSFVSELARRLQGQSSGLALALTWIEQQLSESSTTIDQLIQQETQKQASAQVSISNSIGSLRHLGAIDWRRFVEQHSLVEQVLREDPSQDYEKMDFTTRDLYRHVIEKLAKRSRQSEGDVARKSIELAAKAKSQTDSPRRCHVGFYLVGNGLTELKNAIGARHSIADAFAAGRRENGSRLALLIYLGPIVVLSGALTAFLLSCCMQTAVLPRWLLVLTALASLIATSQLSIAIVNWIATLCAHPRPLPKMDFSEGIPSQYKTLVAIPTMLVSAPNIELLIENLEIRFLANRDQNLHFALLTDFLDAADETTAQDDELLDLAQQKIEELNEKHAAGDDDIFFLFHRPRTWNANEQVWMGYERKRGKLADLNAVLRGSAGRFSRVVGNVETLRPVKYVITLDTDTQLPRDAARQFVGTMAHPLNRVAYDEATNIVVDGYGILQPRVGVSLSGNSRSYYAAMHGNGAGIDPYTRTVSDVYQDVFQEGSFIGKGIYEVDAFERILKDRFPDNRILSHDLLEGCFLRSGLLSDVQLFEEYPAGYFEDVSRRHRWIRGDWQLLDWLLPHLPSGTKGGTVGDKQTKEANPLSLLSRWKIFDNLRRSLVPPALLLLLLLGWTALSQPWLWTAAVVAIVCLPPILFSLLELVKKPEDQFLEQHVAATVSSALRNLSLASLELLCLPYEAYFSLDAIVRTLVRMWLTHRHLLAWRPSGEANKKDRRDLPGSFVQMAISPSVSIAVFMLLMERSEALSAALPLLAAWVVSPLVIWWISRPLGAPQANITLEQRQFLGRIARRTWAFFEAFVTLEENWLPPDNVQEIPVETIAHRTSPTNMGLSLLANLTAYDLGYIQAGELLDRTEKTLATMQSLERHRGHLYNWYDTLSLKPLPPRYISTVDSGNLAGHLLTLNPGLLALYDESILPLKTFAGIEDALGLFNEAGADAAAPAAQRLAQELKEAQAKPPLTLLSMHDCLAALNRTAAEMVSQVSNATDSQAYKWANAVYLQCSHALQELVFLAPWTEVAALLEALRGGSNNGDGSSFEDFERIPTLRELSALSDRWTPLSGADNAAGFQDRKRLDELLALVFQASRRAQVRMTAIDDLVRQSIDQSNMEYSFLFDKARQLLSIGYNADERRLDSSFYDLLASEARLCNYVAIAQDQLPQESWFALGRLLTTTSGKPVLYSWSGSMFEYLMPLLVMPTYANTLLDESYKSCVARQIEYGKQRNVPWGISESGYNTFDGQLNYQYRAFGVPGLGLKRGLSQDLVIAPYATALCLMVAPEEACLNLERMAGEGFVGQYGFFEAIDYTTARLPRGQNHIIIQSFMAHHQGMTLLSLAHLLTGKLMHKRFESDPSFQATALLLQEKVPKTNAYHSQTAETSELRQLSNGTDEAPVRFFDSADTAVPEVQLLSNGNYHVMMTNAGSGYSRYKDLSVTRWREDTTRDNWGSYCFIRDAATGEFWSTTHQPTCKPAESYEAIFSEARVEFRRRDYDIDCHSEIVVSSEDDIELRRVRITNRSRHRRKIDVTSYAEVVLASSAHDSQHPAFSNLFVQTEIIDERQAILCYRRPRSQDESSPMMFHLLAVHGARSGNPSYETDRMQFIGRGRTLGNPGALQENISKLQGTQGSVLDPIVAIRCQITLEPEQSATVNIVTGIAENRESCLLLVAKYQDRHLADRVFDLAWTHSQVVLRQLNAAESDGQLYARLANSVLYANASLRADASILIKNRRGQSGLWGYAISGDLPIVLLQIKNQENIDLVRQLVQAHAYWRLKGLAVDLVIWNEDQAGYRQQIQEQIMGLIASGVEAHLMDKPGGIFVRAAEQISNEDRILLQSVARAIIKDTQGTLAEQLGRRNLREPKVSRLVPSRPYRAEPAAAPGPPRQDLVLHNGFGGFTNDGREYVIETTHNRITPLPWVNVLANTFFGTVVSESGMSYTWLENAHEFRLTPWGNDPVSDSGGEAIYLRDEETGFVWSPCPLPVRGINAYTTRHGFGYTVFEHTENGISTELTIYVAIDAPIKISAIKIRNHSGRSRRLSATAYVEWVLGDLRPKTMMHVVTEIDAKTGALFARNPYNTEFAERVAFLDAEEASRSVTGDRTEFIGRNGNLKKPAAMSRARLSGRVGAGLDPCSAIQVPFELGDGQEREIVFRLGIGRNLDDAVNLVNRFRGAMVRSDAFESLCHYWKHTLGTVNVQTPDTAINMISNGWLLYQTIACRLWGRSGYYQSGGAFGFRDQLQDTMALVHAEPLLLRKQLLLCASRQFVEGDVQHWWHPPSGRGVRTRCSDDYLWLPLAASRYVSMTGDTGVLSESTHFLTGRAVNPQDESYYDLPGRSEETASLYEHCKLAILNGLKFGSHGLPLMGAGDWNDGMNLVGAEGKGESVWLAFFLHEVLRQFTPIAKLREDTQFVERCQKEAKKLRNNIEKHCWDGSWYRRAYFDDGTALGSAANDECQIDSISQSWSVLSGAATEERSLIAMQSVNDRLVRSDRKLIQLLDPPFDKSELNPGYIKGYVPGVRENGGQYTHAAVWATMAFAALNDSERAWQLMNLINPANHALSPGDAAVYKVEPYVVAADVYAIAPHVGRGGWTWYTGSAAWMYRLILESLLGIRLNVDKLSFAPCLPASWNEYKVHYRYRETVYHITFVQIDDESAGQMVTLDNVPQSDDCITLVEDRVEHFVEVRMPRVRSKTADAP